MIISGIVAKTQYFISQTPYLISTIHMKVGILLHFSQR